MAFTNDPARTIFQTYYSERGWSKGQKKLLNSSVLIIGAGGLGAPAALFFAAAGGERLELQMQMSEPFQSSASGHPRNKRYWQTKGTFRKKNPCEAINRM